MIEAVVGLGDIDDMPGHDRGLVLLACFLDHCRHLIEQGDQLVGAVAGDVGRVKASLCFSDDILSRVAEDAAGSGVGVLDVGTGLAFEVEHVLPGEDIVLDPVVGQLIEDDRADTDGSRCLLDVLCIDILFFDDLSCLIDRPVQDVFQEDDPALSGGHGTFLHADQTEGNVDAVAGPFVSHHLQDLDPLLEVQVLLGCDHVDVLVEIIGLLAVYGRRDVPGDVQGGTIGLGDQSHRQIVVIQADDLCSLVLFQKALVLQLLDEAGHLIGIKALSVVGIEADPQHVVDPVELLQRLIPEPLPQLNLFLLTVLQLGEGSSGLVLQGRILLRLDVELLVVLQQGLDGLIDDIFPVAPLAVGHDHLAELGPVVAQVVDPEDVVSQEVIDVGNRVSDNGAADVADMEGLGDVGR